MDELDQFLNKVAPNIEASGKAMQETAAKLKQAMANAQTNVAGAGKSLVDAEIGRAHV